MKHEKRAARHWALALAILLGSGLFASASTPSEGQDVYGSWVVMDLENAGMHIYTTFTIHPDRIDVASRCSYGDKQVEANATAPARVTENEITVTEARNVEREYSPGFLTCRAAIKTGTLSYKLVDAKLVLTMAGQEKSHEFSRPSS